MLFAEGGKIPASPPSQPFPVPYSDNFDTYPVSSEAAFFSDQAGSWEIVDATDTSRGRVLRQAVGGAT